MVTHRVLDLNVRVLLLRLLQPLDQLVQVLVGALVELGRRDVGGHCGVLHVLRLLRRRVLALGHDAAHALAAVEGTHRSPAGTDSCSSDDDAIGRRRGTQRRRGGPAKRQRCNSCSSLHVDDLFPMQWAGDGLWCSSGVPVLSAAALARSWWSSPQSITAITSYPARPRKHSHPPTSHHMP
jgi:hypothetical protein